MPWSLPSNVQSVRYTDPNGRTQFDLADLDGDGLADLYVTLPGVAGVAYMNQSVAHKLLVQVSSPTTPTSTIITLSIRGPSMSTTSKR